MKIILFLSLHYTTILAVDSSLCFNEEGVVADICTPDVCKAKDGCRCASSSSPLDLNQETPQLISFTFEEAVTENTFNSYWEPLFFNRFNPDGKPIGVTFFVPHEYSDYVMVNALYNHGFEIGVNSITRNIMYSYWPSASKELLEKEFGGQKHILNKFGNIPEKDIVGVRTPYLQMAGNSSINAYQAVGLAYDSSWTTLPENPLHPYTLDYLSPQECLYRSICPNEAFKGFWVLPINDLRSDNQKDCYNLASCYTNINGTADEIAEWLLNEISHVRTTTRVPLTITLQSAWFEFIENSFEGLSKLLDELINYKDIFLVTQKQVLDWIKHPVPLSEFNTDSFERNSTCTPYKCKLQKLNQTIRYMESCSPCPANYPWLDNPDGN